MDSRFYFLALARHCLNGKRTNLHGVAAPLDVDCFQRFGDLDKRISLFALCDSVANDSKELQCSVILCRSFDGGNLAFLTVAFVVALMFMATLWISIRLYFMPCTDECGSVVFTVMSIATPAGRRGMAFILISSAASAQTHTQVRYLVELLLCHFFSCGEGLTIIVTSFYCSGFSLGPLGLAPCPRFGLGTVVSKPGFNNGKCMILNGLYSNMVLYEFISAFCWFFIGQLLLARSSSGFPANIFFHYGMCTLNSCSLGACFNGNSFPYRS